MLAYSNPLVQHMQEVPRAPTKFEAIPAAPGKWALVIEVTIKDALSKVAKQLREDLPTYHLLANYPINNFYRYGLVQEKNKRHPHSHR